VTRAPSFLRRWSRDASLLQLFRHSGVLVAGDVGANAIQVVTLALTAKALGPENLGILVLVQTYASILDTLVNFQTWKALIAFGAGHLQDGAKEPLMGLIKIGFLIDLASALTATLLAIGGAFVVASYRGLDDSTRAMLIAYSVTILFNLAGAPTAVLRLFERFKIFSLQKTLAATVKLIGVLVAMLTGAGLWGFLVVSIVANVLGSLVLVFFGLQTMRRNGLGRFLRARTENWGTVFRFTVWTNLNSTFAIPIKHLDMAIVGALVSLEGVGVYKIIKQIALVMTMVSDSVYQVIYPRLAGFLARKDLRGAIVQARRTGAALLSFTAAASVAVALFAPPLLARFLGEGFTHDDASLNAYMFLRAVSCAFVVVHPLFLAMGYVKSELWIQLAANLLYLAAAWILGSHFGLLGIVLAYGIQFSSVLAPKLVIIRTLAGRTPQVVQEPAG